MADIAGSLGLTTVAEGVEDEACLRALHQLGCDVAQGYHISRPMPMELLTPWLIEHGVGVLGVS